MLSETRPKPIQDSVGASIARSAGQPRHLHHGDAGVVGAACGQHLLAANPVPTSHEAIGWLVVALTTMQLFAFLLRPPLVR